MKNLSLIKIWLFCEPNARNNGTQCSNDGVYFFFLEKKRIKKFQFFHIYRKILQIVHYYSSKKLCLIVVWFMSDHEMCWHALLSSECQMQKIHIDVIENESYCTLFFHFDFYSFMNMKWLLVYIEPRVPTI